MDADTKAKLAEMLDDFATSAEDVTFAEEYGGDVRRAEAEAEAEKAKVLAFVESLLKG